MNLPANHFLPLLPCIPVAEEWEEKIFKKGEKRFVLPFFARRSAPAFFASARLRERRETEEKRKEKMRDLEV